jgi:hypothetical protein
MTKNQAAREGGTDAASRATQLVQAAREDE